MEGGGKNVNVIKYNDIHFSTRTLDKPPKFVCVCFFLGGGIILLPMHGKNMKMILVAQFFYDIIIIVPLLMSHALTPV